MIRSSEIIVSFMQDEEEKNAAIVAFLASLVASHGNNRMLLVCLPHRCTALG